MKFLLPLILGLLFLLPTPALAQKRIEVDLSSQKLYAFDNENKVYDFIISSGKPWWPTPTGEFKPVV